MNTVEPAVSGDPMAAPWPLFHPDFETALRKFTASAIALYVSMPRMRRYSIDRGTFSVTIAMAILHFSPDGLTANRLKAVCKASGVCSDGRTAAIIAYMRGRGDLIATQSRPGARGRRLMPSAAIMEYLRERIRHTLTAIVGFSPIVESTLRRIDDPAFLANFMAISSRLATLNFLGQGKYAVINFFSDRDAGMYLLYEIINVDGGVLRGVCVKISVSALSKRLGVSRAHILKILDDAHRMSYLTWSRERREVVLGKTLSEGLMRMIAGLFALQIHCASEAERLMPGTPASI